MSGKHVAWTRNQRIAEVGASHRPGLPNMKPSTGHVLYIEDDEDTRELVKYALGMSNYKVIAAANLEDALRLARTNQFDLYLIDNWISGGSGIELCRKLREFDAWTPILFYSGAALERDKQEATPLMQIEISSAQS
ncbi:MAG: hypothetical protein QOG23_4740 [Blastocatellia bacterium]|nr:hypothetical protein [Blastocatellia bacterium]